jgi:hypothetical protein
MLIATTLAAMLGAAAAGATEWRPKHHNIPATVLGHEEGPVYYLCATMPRIYALANGQPTIEEDHYLQSSPCPAIPVK